MPEQLQITFNIEHTLEALENYTTSNYHIRCQNYKNIQNLLDKGEKFNVTTVKRILTICFTDILKDNSKYTVLSLNIVKTLLKKIKAGDFSHLSLLTELVNTYLLTMELMKMMVTTKNNISLKGLCIDLILTFTNEVHITLVCDHGEKFLELFETYFHCVYENNKFECCLDETIQTKLLCLLKRILTILPPDKMYTFVKNGISVWFSCLINFTLFIMDHKGPLSSLVIEVLEMLTDQLIAIDYSEYTSWLNILENISTPAKFPVIMKSSLEKGSDNWHKIWCILIKLLKNQITMNKSKNGSPINSMLPVVEMGFKMDVQNRCRAFTCWKILTDNFATEANETLINKRIKLLVIPLKSNNAKVEATALAKFHTWWYMIISFKKKMIGLSESILVPFLHYSFGNVKKLGSDVFIPGKHFPLVTSLCLQAFVEITGHVDCDGGCISNDIMKLKNRLLNAVILVDHFNDWMFSLKHASKSLIQLIEKDDILAKRQIKCIWKSYIQILSSLPDNGIRRDMFTEILKLLSALIEECNNENISPDVIFNILLVFLSDEYENTKNLFKTCKHQEGTLVGPFKRILKRALNPYCNKDYTLSSEGVTKLQSVIKSSLGLIPLPHDLIDCILNTLSANNNSHLIWTTLTDSIIQLNLEFSSISIENILTWPIKNMPLTDTAIPALTWYKMYTYTKTKFNKTPHLDVEILELLMANDEGGNPTFTVYVLSSVLNTMLSTEDIPIEDLKLHVVKTLTNSLKNVENYQDLKIIFSTLINCIVLLTTKLSKSMDETVAENIISAVDCVIKCFLKGNQCTRNEEDKDLQSSELESLLKNLHKMFDNNTYLKFKHVIVHELIAVLKTKNSSLTPIVNLIIEQILTKIKSDDEVYLLLKECITADHEENDSAPEKKKKDNKSSTPSSKVKKPRKKSIDAVNKVVENGEEFIVVQSNWKFNPKKLTEHQKEILQKKREDIPALYQDLSQSQDEFKMKSWTSDNKFDSQDSSTSNSKTMRTDFKNNIEPNLKNLPNSDIVPQMMSMLTEKPNEVKRKVVVNEQETNQLGSMQKVTTIATKSANEKHSKSPRMALKDRVMLNAKNLLDNVVLKEPLIKVTNLNITPNSNLNKTSHITNSAPPKNNIDRPSRVKRKPKKYETDFQVLAMKKRRNSTIGIISTSEIEVNEVKTGTELLLDDIESQNENIQKDNQFQNTCSTNNDIVSKNINTEENAIDLDETQCESINIGKENEILSQNESECKINDIFDSYDKVKSEAVITEESGKLNVSKIKTKPRKHSRLVKELAIDTVEGNPFLKTTTEEHLKSASKTRRKRLDNNLNNSQAIEDKTILKVKKNIGKSVSKASELSVKVVLEQLSVNTKDNHKDDMEIVSSNDLILSEDFIESSQESTLSAIKTTRRSLKKQSIGESPKSNIHIVPLLPNNDVSKDILLTNTESQVPDTSEKNDNISVEDNLTALMDTEPVNQTNYLSSDEVIVISDDPIHTVVVTQDTYEVSDKQEILNADIQPIDEFTQLSNTTTSCTKDFTNETDNNVPKTKDLIVKDVTMEIENIEINNMEGTGLSSPFKDEMQRNKDFLNNTLDISPIRITSPERENNKTPSPEKTDYYVIKLTSPVQSNGEPIDNCDSPEMFTEEKVSPSKYEESPPRITTTVNNNSSPSSSLSLKKNRPQMRVSGRAAQMLGLCFPDRLQSITNGDKVTETEENRKSSPMNTPARRNLKTICNNVNDNDIADDNDDTENILKFKRLLPSVDSSPSGPILKRKLADIADDVTVSPASKRKRVSFHDPPVSTTMSVYKYIEPCGIRSPQSSHLKRLEKQQKLHSNLKSPKKLDNVFKMVALTPSEKSLVTDANSCSSDVDTSSLDQTPLVEVVKNCDLNDTDPICPDLIDCADPIGVIATELSSPAMKSLLIKELEGNIVSIGDLAKLTELEVNRLCIKAPKIKVAKKVLNDYCNKKAYVISSDENKEIKSNKNTEKGKSVSLVDTDMQTVGLSMTDAEVQTDMTILEHFGVQTDVKKISNILVQTDESGFNSMRDTIEKYIKESSEYVDVLGELLNKQSKQKIINSLPFSDIVEILGSKISNESDNKLLLDEIFKSESDDKTDRLKVLTSYLCDKRKFSPSVLIKFCSELLQKVHNVM